MPEFKGCGCCTNNVNSTICGYNWNKWRPVISALSTTLLPSSRNQEELDEGAVLPATNGGKLIEIGRFALETR